MATLKQIFILRIAFFSLLFIYGLQNESQWDSLFCWIFSFIYLFIYGLHNIRYTSMGFNVVLEFTDFFNRLQFYYLYIFVLHRGKRQSLFYLITVIASFSDIKVLYNGKGNLNVKLWEMNRLLNIQYYIHQ